MTHAPSEWRIVAPDAADLDVAGERVGVIGTPTHWQFFLNGEQIAVRDRAKVGDLGAAQVTAYYLVGLHFGAIIREASNRRERFAAVARAAGLSRGLVGSPAAPEGGGQ